MSYVLTHQFSILLCKLIFFHKFYFIRKIIKIWRDQKTANYLKNGRIMQKMENLKFAGSAH